MNVTIAKPFGSTQGYPFFDFGEVVHVTEQENGLYTVTRNEKEPSAVNTVVDVPADRLDFHRRAR